VCAEAKKMYRQHLFITGGLHLFSSRVQLCCKGAGWTVLDQPALVQFHHTIHVGQRGQSVRDDHHRGPCKVPPNGVLHEPVRPSIHLKNSKTWHSRNGGHKRGEARRTWEEGQREVEGQDRQACGQTRDTPHRRTLILPAHVNQQSLQQRLRGEGPHGAFGSNQLSYRRSRLVDTHNGGASQQCPAETQQLSLPHTPVLAPIRQYGVQGDGPC
jgi:hypothetical protein